MKQKFIPKKDIDYVALYAAQLKEDSSFFRQQKSFIESQYKASRSLFRNMFGSGEMYKKNARAYLKKLGIIKTLPHSPATE